MSEHAIPLLNASVTRSERRAFIGGSDARTIMGDDEPALHPIMAREAPRNRAAGPL